LLAPPLACDAELRPSDLTPSFIDALTRCGPFGVGNPEPIFASFDLTLAAPIRLIQDKHVSLSLRREGCPITINAVGWTRRIDWPRLCSSLDLQPGSRIDIVYRIRENSNPRFPGIDLELVELRLSSSTSSVAPE
jgi:single-stranded-DNA-specific exonuclease